VPARGRASSVRAVGSTRPGARRGRVRTRGLVAVLLGPPPGADRGRQIGRRDPGGRLAAVERQLAGVVVAAGQQHMMPCQLAGGCVLGDGAAHRPFVMVVRPWYRGRFASKQTYRGSLVWKLVTV